MVYSGIGEKADEVIKRTIGMKKKNWIVITSDREIVNRAWLSDCIPVKSELFEVKMLMALDQRDHITPYEDLEDDDTAGTNLTGTRKGNPRRLSRREKAVRNALEKL